MDAAGTRERVSVDAHAAGAARRVASRSAELDGGGAGGGGGGAADGSRGAPARKEQVCSACGSRMTGQFVRALGGVYHLDCFRCADCGKGVANKFFSATADMVGEQGRLFPLCETDYFRRLDLLCSQCGGALRGSYITALGVKFHVEHFTCSVCPTVFGPQDSYYEHEGKVYCHFHYSTRFAIQCMGCGTAILKQYVEINRNNADEHWHPECYMIHRFWKIKLGRPPAPRGESEDETERLPMPGALSLPQADARRIGEAALPREVLELEARETPASLLQQQHDMEQRVFTIWRVLSTFEESSAACISDMLRHVSSGKYLGGVRFAGRFVLHVEVLFAAIDELEAQCRRLDARAIQYVREARMLCKKVVNFFSLFSHAQQTGARRMSITQELLSLVTGLAHYLKVLIRISLTSALRLDREYACKEALTSFLGRLDALVSHGGDDDGKVRGYASVPHGAEDAGATDLCVQCTHTIEEECLRTGVAPRWHWGCLRCRSCRRSVLRADGTPAPPRRGGDAADGAPRAVALAEFVYVGGAALCAECAPGDAACVPFAAVTRLEQYAFLLHVALNRLHVLLRKREAQAASPRMEAEPVSMLGELHVSDGSETSTLRRSQEMKRLETVFVDRHVSNKAKMPRISTVVGGPTAHRTQPGGEGEAGAAVRAAAGETRLPRGDEQAAAGAAGAAGGTIKPIRPPFARFNTDVLVREEEEVRKASGDVSPGLPTEENITLADIPHLLQAEQEREQSGDVGPGARRPISDLSPRELFVVKHVALARLRSSALAEHVRADEWGEFLDARKATFWGKLFKGGPARKEQRKRGVFGVALEQLVERSGTDSTLGAAATPLRVPTFVDDVVSAMKQMDVSVEGIFRKNGNVRRLKELADAIDREEESVNLLDDNPVQLAALLKKFFRELPDPLLTARLHPLFVLTQQVEDPVERHRLLQLVTVLMPKAHRDTMEVLFVFLKWVASFSHVDEETGSRMDLANLATVMCPNILYSRTNEPARGEAIQANRVVYHLLERQDEFWTLPSDMEPVLADRELLEDASEMSTHEALRRCAQYAR